MMTFKNDGSTTSSNNHNTTTSTSAFRPSLFPLLQNLNEQYLTGSLLSPLLTDESLLVLQGTNHDHNHGPAPQGQESQQGRLYYLPFDAHDVQEELMMVMPSPPPHSVRGGRRISCSSRFCSPPHVTRRSTITEIIDVVLRIIQEDEDFHHDHDHKQHYYSSLSGRSQHETTQTSGTTIAENEENEEDPQTAAQEEDESRSRSIQEGQHQ